MAENSIVAACDNTAIASSTAANEMAEHPAMADFSAAPPDPPSPPPKTSTVPGDASPSNLQPPAHVVSITKPTNDHIMRTRAKSGFKLPTQKLNLNVTPSISPIPKSYKSDLLDPH
jgi:hypothetical protein